LSTDLKESLRMWAKIEADGPQEQPTVITFAVAMDRYLREVMPSKSPTTQRIQGYQAAKLREIFGHMPLAAITGTHIGQYLDQSPAPVVANREIGLASHLFTKSIRWGYLNINPALGVERHKEKARTRYISDAELAALVRYAEPPVRTAILLAYYTAQRVGDLLGLRWKDVDAETLRFVQDKTGAVVVVGVDHLIEQVLALVERDPRSDFVIQNTKGQQYAYHAFAARFRKCCELAQLPGIHFHDIRAKAATDMDEDEAQPRDIQALLGHKNAAMTERYIKTHKQRTVKPVGRAVRGV
jgi:integrase